MRRNSKTKPLTDLEIIVLVAIIYVVVVFLLRLWSPVIAIFDVNKPLNHYSFGLNLIQIAAWLLAVLTLVVGISCVILFVVISVSFIFQLLCIIIAAIFEILRCVYNLITHIFPLPYFERPSIVYDIFEGEPFHTICELFN